MTPPPTGVAATGKRYAVTSGGKILFAAAYTETSLPGSTAGTVDANGSMYGAFPVPSGLRELLSTHRDYYVSTTGSNANNGLSSGTAFQTLQYAWDYVASNVDCNAYNVTFILAAGTYAGLGAYTGNGLLNPNNVTIQGVNSGAKTTTIIDSASPSPFSFYNMTHPVQVQWLTLKSASSAGLYATGCWYIFCDTCDFQIGAGAFMLDISNNTRSYIAGCALVSSANVGGFLSTSGNSYNMIVGMSGTTTVSQATVKATTYASINLVGSVTGTVTGKRYDVQTGASIVGPSLTVTSFPGTVAGTVDANASVYGTFPTPAGMREKLSANRTYYVRTDGNNSNTGLTNNAAGAFLNLTGAMAVLGTLDLGGKCVTIQLQDGTWTWAYPTIPPLGTQRFSQTTNAVGYPGTVTVQGNTTTPANVIITSIGNPHVCDTPICFHGVSFPNSVSPYYAGSNTSVAYGTVNIGTSGQIAVALGAEMFISGTVTWAGGGTSTVPVNISRGGKMWGMSGALFAFGTLTVTNTLEMKYGGWADFGYMAAFTGTVTGKRHNILSGSMCIGSGLTQFPGTIAGTADAATFASFQV